MKLYVGVTDNDWYRFLSQLSNVDEVNFWQPGGTHLFKPFQGSQVSGLVMDIFRQRTASRRILWTRKPTLFAPLRKSAKITSCLLSVILDPLQIIT